VEENHGSNTYQKKQHRLHADRITEATIVAHSATAAARTLYISAPVAWDGAVYTVDYICEKALY